ncbi:MAG: ATP-binding cassette domain-containing protein [Rheinheimera sp.]
MLVFDHLCHHFDNAVIFHQLSFTIDAPRVLITGANGSGKTTLLLLAAGLIKPKAGRVSFRGQDVLQRQAKRWIGISANKVELPVFMTVQELLQFQAQQFAGVFAGGPAAGLNAHRPDLQHNKGSQQPSDRSAADVTDWVGEFGLTPFLRTKVGDLSLGNAKKLSLILALQHQPQLLLLDEPSNGLDEQARAALVRVLTDYPGQVIVASHEPLSAGDVPMLHLPLATLVSGQAANLSQPGTTA